MNRAISRAVFVAFILIFCSIVASTPAYAVSYPFTENFEGATGNWCLDAPWGTTTLFSYSPTHSLTDSPGGSYGASSDVSATLCSPVDLTSSVVPMLSFWNRYAFEENADWGSVEVSADGINWTPLLVVTGQQATWKQEQIDLSEYEGLELYIRFRLQTNGSVNYDGWYIDDVRIEESAATISYPLFDGMEGGTANWLPSGWELASPGQAGSYCWYKGKAAFGYQNALTLADTIDLTSAVNPQLSFWYKSDATWWAQQYVQVSDSFGHGGTYQTIVAFGNTSGLWKQGQVDLSNYIGLPDVRIRFLNPYGENWWIDNIRIEDTPPTSAVVIYPPTTVSMHGAQLSWKKYGTGIGPMFAGFARYEVYRAKTQYFDRPQGELICQVTDIDQTSYADAYTVMQPDYYWYRLYIVDTNGMYSVPSDPVQAVYTIPYVSYPFVDDMEGGTSNWEWGYPWGQTTTTSHSSNHCWTDSPGGSYGFNKNTAMTTSINLRSAQMPMLSFWDRYAIQENVDWGIVEVSTDGSNWTPLLIVTGQRASWKQEKIDLSEYAGFDLFFRFRLQTDGATSYDGWYIDDVRIEESTATISYPFSDGMEGGTGNWLPSGWELSSPGQAGNYCWYKGGVATGYSNGLTLAGTIDLSAAIRPQLSFWYKSEATWWAQQYVQISDNYGHAGTYQLAVGFGNTGGLWRQGQVDLSNFIGLPDVRIRFLNPYGEIWRIDEVSVKEGPPVELTLVPDAPSVARGGTLGYTVTVTNKTANNRTFKYWTNVNLPNGAQYPPAGALFGPVSASLGPYATKSVHLTQTIPASAPLGVYKYNGYIGTYPSPVTDDGPFYFEVVP